MYYWVCLHCGIVIMNNEPWLGTGETEGYWLALNGTIVRTGQENLFHDTTHCGPLDQVGTTESYHYWHNSGTSRNAALEESDEVIYGSTPTPTPTPTTITYNCYWYDDSGLICLLYETGLLDINDRRADPNPRTTKYTPDKNPKFLRWDRTTTLSGNVITYKFYSVFYTEYIADTGDLKYIVDYTKKLSGTTYPVVPVSLLKNYGCILAQSTSIVYNNNQCARYSDIIKDPNPTKTPVTVSKTVRLSASDRIFINGEVSPTLCSDTLTTSIIIPNNATNISITINKDDAQISITEMPGSVSYVLSNVLYNVSPVVALAGTNTYTASAVLMITGVYIEGGSGGGGGSAEDYYGTIHGWYAGEFDGSVTIKITYYT